jgi:hypothetical protein
MSVRSADDGSRLLTPRLPLRSNPARGGAGKTILRSLRSTAADCWCAPRAEFHHRVVHLEPDSAAVKLGTHSALRRVDSRSVQAATPELAGGVPPFGGVVPDPSPGGGFAAAGVVATGGGSAGGVVATGDGSAGGVVATGDGSAGGAVATGDGSAGGVVATGDGSAGGAVATGGVATGGGVPPGIGFGLVGPGLPAATGVPLAGAGRARTLPAPSAARTGTATGTVRAVSL